MADPSTYRPAPGTIPESPGVYRFCDEQGQVIYVGKAKSLRQRLNSYFANLVDLHPRTQSMLTTAASVQWTVVANEVEALVLEYSWIKQFDPRFNVKFRDDKSYPWLAVSISERFPRLQVMRGQKRPGVRYFGPYAHAWAIRETLDLLLRAFPARTCSAGVFKRAQAAGRPCLLGYIDKCSAPCVGRVSEEEHRQIVNDFCAFLSGDTATYLRRLEKEMQAAAAQQEYEKAARVRDNLSALHQAMERNAVVLPDATDADVIGLAHDGLQAAVQVFHVRGGRVRGQRSVVLDVWDPIEHDTPLPAEQTHQPATREQADEVDEGTVIGRFLEQFYLGTPNGTTQPGPTAAGQAQGYISGVDETATKVPREILVSALPGDVTVLQQVLGASKGSAVQVKVPRRGAKKDLLHTVSRNAQQALNVHHTKQASDLNSRSAALHDIQQALGLAQAPLRIECIDVSHLQGSHTVASVVVFEDGLPRKNHYMRFTLKQAQGNDDVAAIAEVVTRRMRRYLNENASSSPPQTHSLEDHPPVKKPLSFVYPPQLLVIDGGAPQVQAAAKALEQLAITSVGLCGLAKRLEEVWLPDQPFPVIMPRSSQGLYLLQRVRDEAHRFALTFHRTKRGKAATVSALDSIAGIGPARRKALIEHFGSLKELRQATIEQIMTVPGFARPSATALHQELREQEVTSQAGPSSEHTSRQ